MGWKQRRTPQSITAPGGLCLLGFAAPLSWRVLIVRDVTEHTFDLKMAGLLGLLAACVVAVMLVSTVGERRRDRVFRGASLISCACMCLVPAWALAGPTDGVVFLVLTFLAEAGRSWFIVCWLGLYARLGIKTGSFYLLAAYALGNVFELFFGSLTVPAPIVLVFVIVCSAAGVPALERARSASFAQPEGGRGRAPTWHVLLMLVEISVYGLILSVLQGFSIEVRREMVATWVIASLLKVAVPCMLASFVGRTRAYAGNLVLTQSVLAAITVVLAGLVFLGAQGQLVAAVLIILARDVAQLFFMLILVELARQATCHPFVTIGLGRVAYQLTMPGGVVFGELFGALGATDEPTVDVVFFATACMVLFMTLFTVRSRRVLIERDEPATAPPETPSASAGDAPEALELLARTYQLSDREVQISLLLCRGRSVAYVANDLAISENTVRYHCKKLYAKLGIHRKQELLDLVEGALDETRS